jgi:hypothetical protein
VKVSADDFPIKRAVYAEPSGGIGIEKAVGFDDLSLDAYRVLSIIFYFTKII